MEPADLNSSASDARLEALLRQPAQPLPDDGFSARVLAALPPAPRRATSPTGLRNATIAAGALAGALLAIFGPMLRSPNATSFNETLTELGRATQSLADPTLAFALVVTALCLLYVFRPRWRLAL